MTRVPPTLPVIIMGAGMVGLTLAQALKKAGIPYEVYERDTSYDTEKGRYVQSGTDNDGFWWVSYAEPWTGNTEHWTNLASSDNQIRHYAWVRTNRNTFSFTEYPSRTATKPDFGGTCSRSS